jgi:hypothetical protein
MISNDRSNRNLLAGAGWDKVVWKTLSAIRYPLSGVWNYTPPETGYRIPDTGYRLNIGSSLTSKHRSP